MYAKRRLHRQETVQDERPDQFKQLGHSHRRATWSNLILLPLLIGMSLVGALIGATHAIAHSVLLGTVLGALVGAGGLVLLILLAKMVSRKAIREGIKSFREGILEGIVESGCCLGLLTLFMVLAGTVSGLIIWLCS